MIKKAHYLLLSFIIGISVFGLKTQDANAFGTLNSATYLGGIDADSITAMAADPFGNIYVAGTTYSTDFPTTGTAYDKIYNWDDTAFITRLSPDLSQVLSSTYMKGIIRDIKVDKTGYVYVVGESSASGFPTTPGAYDTKGNQNGFTDAFITKFSSNLSIMMASTLFGGESMDRAVALDIDSNGNIYVVGDTTSSQLPVKGTLGTVYNNNYDVFVSKFNSTLSSLLGSGYFGGISADNASDIVVGTANDIYVVGRSFSFSLPGYQNGYQKTPKGNMDMFVTRLYSDLSGVLATTYLGGSGVDAAEGLAQGTDGSVYIAGITKSSNYPVTNNSYKTNFSGTSDAAVTKLSSDLGNILSSTYIGGVQTSALNGFFLDSSNAVYLVGYTDQTTMSNVQGYDKSYNGGLDAFGYRLTSDLTSMTMNTYFGGSGSETATAVVRSPSGVIYMAGITGSSNLPVSANAYDKIFNGIEDGFIASFSELSQEPVSNMPDVSMSLGAYSLVQGQNLEVNISGTKSIMEFIDSGRYDIRLKTSTGLTVVPSQLYSASNGLAITRTYTTSSLVPQIYSVQLYNVSTGKFITGKRVEITSWTRTKDTTASRQ